MQVLHKRGFLLMENNQKTYKVPEAALILKEKGVVKGKNAEQRVRWWINKYNKEFESILKPINRTLKEESEEDRRNRAHQMAIRHGIRAEKKSNKEGYIISESDLSEFITHKRKDVDEWDFFDIGIQETVESMEKVVEELKKEDIITIKNEADFKHGFMKGFTAAVEILQKRNQDKVKIKEEIKETIINFPKEHYWFLKKEDMIVNSFKQYGEGMKLYVSYKSIPGFEVEFYIYELTSVVIKTSINLEEGYVLSKHNEHYIKNLFREYGKKEYTDSDRLRIEENKLAFVEIAQKLTTSSESEHRFFALMFFTRVLDILQKEIGELNDSCRSKDKPKK